MTLFALLMIGKMINIAGKMHYFKFKALHGLLDLSNQRHSICQFRTFPENVYL